MAMMDGDTQTIIEFKKGDKVTLPRHLWRGSRQTGIIDSEMTTTFKTETYYSVKLDTPTHRYRQRNLDQSSGIVLVKASELRLQVLHSLCPSCRCVLQPTQLLEGEEEEKEDDGFEEEDEEDIP
jgi:hypothetical protein